MQVISVMLIWGVVGSFYAILWKTVERNAKRIGTRKTAAKSTKRKKNKNQHEDDNKPIGK